MKIVRPLLAVLLAAAAPLAPVAASAQDASGAGETAQSAGYEELYERLFNHPPTPAFVAEAERFRAEELGRIYPALATIEASHPGFLADLAGRLVTVERGFFEQVQQAYRPQLLAHLHAAFSADEVAELLDFYRSDAVRGLELRTIDNIDLGDPDPAAGVPDLHPALTQMASDEPEVTGEVYDAITSMDAATTAEMAQLVGSHPALLRLPDFYLQVRELLVARNSTQWSAEEQEQRRAIILATAAEYLAPAAGQ